MADYYAHRQYQPETDGDGQPKTDDKYGSGL